MYRLSISFDVADGKPLLSSFCLDALKSGGSFEGSDLREEDLDLPRDEIPALVEVWREYLPRPV
jgi:hypothetical protein